MLLVVVMVVVVSLCSFDNKLQCQEYSGPVALDRRVQKWISSVRTEEGEGVEILGWIRFRGS